MDATEAVVLRLQAAQEMARYRPKIGLLPDEPTRAMASAELSVLSQADLFTWRQDLLEAAMSASVSLPTPVTFGRDSRPCDCGFYLFEKPIEFTGCSKPLCGVAWATMADRRLMRDV